MLYLQQPTSQSAGSCCCLGRVQLSIAFHPAQSAKSRGTNAFKQRALQLQDLELNKARLSVPQFKNAQSFSLYLTSYHRVDNPVRKNLSVQCMP